MTTVTITEDVKLHKTHFSTLSDFMQEVVKNNFPDSGIKDSRKTAESMSQSWLPQDFVSNFLKSYD